MPFESGARYSYFCSKMAHGQNPFIIWSSVFGARRGFFMNLLERSRFFGTCGKKTRWWQLKDFLYFHPDKLGKMSKFDEHISQIGWNHQPEKEGLVKRSHWSFQGFKHLHLSVGSQMLTLNLKQTWLFWNMKAFFSTGTNICSFFATVTTSSGDSPSVGYYLASCGLSKLLFQWHGKVETQKAQHAFSSWLLGISKKIAVYTPQN